MGEKVLRKGSHTFLDQRLEACLDPISAQNKILLSPLFRRISSLRGGFLTLLLQVWVPFLTSCLCSCKIQTYPRLSCAKKPKLLSSYLLSRLTYTRVLLQTPWGSCLHSPPNLSRGSEMSPWRDGRSREQSGQENKGNPVADSDQSGKCLSLVIHTLFFANRMLILIIPLVNPFFTAIR